jgi:hypothetical protein
MEATWEFLFSQFQINKKLWYLFQHNSNEHPKVYRRWELFLLQTMVEIFNEKQVTKKIKKPSSFSNNNFLKSHKPYIKPPNTTRSFGGFNVVHYKRILSRT